MPDLSRLSLLDSQAARQVTEAAHGHPEWAGLLPCPVQNMTITSPSPSVHHLPVWTPTLKPFHTEKGNMETSKPFRAQWTG